VNGFEDREVIDKPYHGPEIWSHTNRGLFAQNVADNSERSDFRGNMPLDDRYPVSLNCQLYSEQITVYQCVTQLLDRVEACREPSQGLWLFFKSFLSIS
jgi:hypothetical protein